MKKSILMAIVALALLAAPAFAGDYSIVGNIDWGFGTSFLSGEANSNAQALITGVTQQEGDVYGWVDADNDPTTADTWGIAVADGAITGTTTQGQLYNVTNDFTMLGFFGSIDDNNSISIVMEYGASGGASFIDGETPVIVQDFNLSTNVLGALGVTGVPVTLNLTAGHGRLNLHNRFQQWTGWEVKRWKDAGTAHFAGSYGSGDPGAWSRPNYVKVTVGILDMVNIAYGIVPYFAQTIQPSDTTEDVVADVPQMIDIWTSGIVVGPVALDIAANLRLDSLKMATGIQVTANMNFGALGLTAFVGEDYQASTDATLDDKGFNNAIVVALKPTYNFGAGSVSLGVWYSLTSEKADVADADTDTTHDLAIDLALSYATFTLYGGVLMQDLTDVDEDDESPMKWEVGVKNSFGAATIGLGITGIAGTEDGSGTVINNHDIGAADGTGNNWLNEDGNATASMYFRVTAWY